MMPLAARASSIGVRPETVRGLWAFMQDRYRTTVHAKADALEMVAVGFALERMGVLSAEEFLKRYATTLGRRIYVPFAIGEGADLWGQMALCAHEHQHVEQLDREGLSFVWNYLSRPAKRALYEADAYVTTLEMHFWRTGELLSADDLSAQLRAYAVGETDIAVARQALAMASVTVRAGGIVTGAARVALGWLEANAPELRYPG